ncbi:unnamed protein product [Rotaria sp. Silwood1]|nr:unnamed protein product [Rotaria sp. Silwood1]
MANAQESIEFLIKQPHVFMFLRRIRDIRTSVNSTIETVLNVSLLKDGSVKISSNNNEMISHWLLHTCKLNVPNEALEDSRLPEKLQQTKIIEMTLATQIDKNNRFVPMRDSKWTDKAHDLLPNRISAKDILADQYNKSCISSVKSVPFLLGVNKRSLLTDEAIVDITLFSSTGCIGHELIRDFLIHTSSKKLRLAANPFVNNNHRLRNLGIKQFTRENCFDMLQSAYFLTRFTPERDIDFISYMFTHRDSTQIQKRLYDVPFLMDQFGHLRKVMEIYLPSRFSNADWHMPDNNDAYIHPMIMNWLLHQSQIKEWLRKLGIHEKTDITFVDDYIIPQTDRYITPTNAIITITRLFVLFQNGLLSTHHLHELGKLKLFTVGSTLVSAYRLYFSSAYLPYLPLDNLNLDEDLFLCPSYLETVDGVSIQQWKYFFQFLGVQENISLMSFDETHHDELVSAYIRAHILNLPRYMVIFGFKNRMTIKFIDLTQVYYQFAIIFWEHVIRSINVRALNENEVLLSQRRILINNLPHWCVRIRGCIPTTTSHLLPSSEVFSGNLRPIAGKYLPVFVCNVRNSMPDLWQQFFGFKTEFSIEDYFLLLDRIYHNSLNTSLDDDEERRIQLIYFDLIDCLSRMDHASRHQYRMKQPFFLLSTQNNEFMLSDKLVVASDNNLILPPQVVQLRLNHENARHTHLAFLLEAITVQQITRNDLTLSNDIKAEFSRSLHAKLRDIYPYLFALVDSQKLTNHSIDCDLEIFEVDRLELFYNKTPIYHVPIHLKNNQLYIKRPWSSDETMKMLPQTLCKHFKLPADFELELKWMLTAKTTIAIDEHFLQRNIPIQVHSFHDDLLNINGTREKFAKLIDRDNAKLFSNLKVTHTMSAAELLLAGLDAQDSKWTVYVYHFTHLENAATIVSERKLKAREQLTSSAFKDSAAENVIKSTRTDAKNYARFYFRPLTPTQCCNENLDSSELIERLGNKHMCPVPIFFRFNLRALLAIENLSWKVSLGNVTSHHTEFNETREIVEKFDFQYDYADSRTQRGKVSSQHEFLIVTFRFQSIDS